ncbi:MAG: ATP phosphoribosyltransferase [Patescibacteria group bacterium]
MRIAIPKGRLETGVLNFLAAAGITGRRESNRCYTLQTDEPSISEMMIVKPRSVPQLVALQEFDVGFCGLDLVRNSEYSDELMTTLDLGLNPVRIIVAAHHTQANILQKRPNRPVRIATEYDRLVGEWAMRKQLPFTPYMTFGSTEGFVPRHADLIMDCAETGDTLRANGLVILEDLFASTTWLVVNRKSVLDDNVRDLTLKLGRAIATINGDAD